MRLRPIRGEKVCENCGEAFPVKALHARTCSALCRQQLFRLERRIARGGRKTPYQTRQWRLVMKELEANRRD